MNMKKTKVVKIGNVAIGGNNPIAIQSMTNTDTKNVEETVKQINSLVEAGCEIVRLSVYDLECVHALEKIKQRVNVPLVADVHFDYRVAIESIKVGVDKVRINPGNIGQKWKVEEVARAAAERNVPIRVGANMGSIDPQYLLKYPDRTDALVASAMNEVKELEDVGFDNIVIAVKSSDAVETLVANEKLSKLTDYPIHLGVTEAGIYEDAVVKSSFALGHLIYEGIGDTIRISIAGDPVREVHVARALLRAVHKSNEVEVVACPTCARTQINVEELAEEVKKEIGDMKANLKIAVMGCLVNGIGEARDADMAVFGTKSGGVIYENGEKIGFVKKSEITKTLRKMIEKRISEEEDGYENRQQC